MFHPLYAQGDTVVLKSGLFRRPVQIPTCQIASVRSDFYGKTEYRVRFEDEIFDRCVTEADIDQAASTASRVQLQLRPIKIESGAVVDRPSIARATGRRETAADA